MIPVDANVGPIEPEPKHPDPPRNTRWSEKEIITAHYGAITTMGDHTTDPNFRRAALLAPEGRPDGPDDDLLSPKTLIVRGMTAEI